MIDMIDKLIIILFLGIKQYSEEKVLSKIR